MKNFFVVFFVLVQIISSLVVFAEPEAESFVAGSLEIDDFSYILRRQDDYLSLRIKNIEDDEFPRKSKLQVEREISDLSTRRSELVVRSESIQTYEEALSLKEDLGEFNSELLKTNKKHLSYVKRLKQFPYLSEYKNILRDLVGIVEDHPDRFSKGELLQEYMEEMEDTISSLEDKYSERRWEDLEDIVDDIKELLEDEAFQVETT